MKKKQQQQQHHGSSSDHPKQHELEIIKAVAQAWYGKSSGSKSLAASEFDTHRRNFKIKPSRFKVEAMREASRRDEKEEDGRCSGRTWDFGESLWDTYEIVTISKRLERGLVLDHHTFSSEGEAGHALKKRKESKNSLRSILNRMSSRRFNEPIVEPDEEGIID